MDSRAKLEESRRLLEKLKREREERAKQRLETPPPAQVTEINVDDTEDDISIQISTVEIPEVIREKPKPVYYVKTTNTDDLEALGGAGNDNLESHVDLDKIREKMEQEIKERVEAEYQAIYKDLLQKKDENVKESAKIIQPFQPTTYHRSVIESLSRQEPPTSAPLYVSQELKGKFVTVHAEHLLCVWEGGSTPRLIYSIRCPTSTSAAEFTINTNTIITGTQLGRLYLYVYDVQFDSYMLSAESSQSLGKPILGIKPTSEAFVLVTRNVEITIVASNLNDVLKPLKMLQEDTILTQVKFIDASRALVGDLRGDVYLVDAGAFELTKIYTSTCMLPVMSLAYKPTLISGLVAISNMDTKVHVLDVNSREIAEIPILSFPIDLTWTGDELVIARLSALKECTYDIWSVDENQMVAKHVKHSPAGLTTRIVPTDRGIIGFDTTGAATTVSLA